MGRSSEREAETAPRSNAGNVGRNGAAIPRRKNFAGGGCRNSMPESSRQEYLPEFLGRDLEAKIPLTRSFAAIPGRYNEAKEIERPKKCLATYKSRKGLALFKEFICLFMISCSKFLLYSWNSHAYMAHNYPEKKIQNVIEF